MSEEEKIYVEYKGDHYIEYRPVTSEYIHKDKIREKIKALRDITRSDLELYHFRQCDYIDSKIELLEDLLK